MTVTRADFIFEPAEEYHSKATDYLSSHQLMGYEDSPALYAYRLTQPQTDTAAFRFGRAAHCYILEGEKAFGKQYILASGDGAPVNTKTGKPFGYDTKKFQDWEKDKKKTGITPEDMETVTAVAEAVKAHAAASALLSDGFPEAVLRETYGGTPCQIRIDWTNPDRNMIVDLKTISDITRFDYQFKLFRYANQMAFYAAVWSVKFGSMPDVAIVAVETNAPYRVGVWNLTPATLRGAKMYNDDIIPLFLISKKTGVYPTYYENERYI